MLIVLLFFILIRKDWVPQRQRSKQGGKNQVKSSSLIRGIGYIIPILVELRWMLIVLFEAMVIVIAVLGFFYGNLFTVIQLKLFNKDQYKLLRRVTIAGVLIE